MAEVVRAWGSECYSDSDAESSAEAKVLGRLSAAGLVAIDDVEVVKTVRDCVDGVVVFRCQAVIRGVKR
jgi:hypothetical protein